MISAQRREHIESILRKELGPFGYSASTMEVRNDSGGDPAIFIVARFDDPTRLPPSHVTTDAMVALGDALRAEGDERFPYLDYVYPDEPVEDEAADAEA